MVRQFEHRIGMFIVVIVVAIALGGCQTTARMDSPMSASTDPDATPADLGAEAPSESGSDVALASEPQPAKVALEAGDVIEVRFFFVPELDTVQVVRPDGAISLLLIGDVPTAGKTPKQLADDLKGLYAPQLVDPELTVTIRSYNWRRVYIVGEVKAPGYFEMLRNMTVVEAIMNAGGFNLATAKPSNVIVLRAGEDGRRESAILDLRETVRGKKPIEPYYLQPSDIVYVPRTRIVRMNQFVEQYINAMIPKIGASYSNTSGTDAQNRYTPDSILTSPLGSSSSGGGSGGISTNRRDFDSRSYGVRW